MTCPGCGAVLGKLNAAGEPMLRMRGLVLKTEGVVALCPKCGRDVPVAGEMARAIQHRFMLVRRERPE